MLTLTKALAKADLKFALSGGKTLEELGGVLGVEHDDRPKAIDACKALLRSRNCVRYIDRGAALEQRKEFWFPPPPGKGGEEGANDEWFTPWPLFSEMDQKYNFTRDLAATAESAKCKLFWTKEDDSLSKSWDGEMGFLNSPYSNIPPFAEKCHDLWTRKAGGVVQLAPAWTDREWWHKFVEPHRQSGELRVEFMKGRVKFAYPGNPLGLGSYDACSFGLVKIFWVPW